MGSLLFMKYGNAKSLALCFAASFGVVATMASAIHETPKARLLMQDEQLEKGRPLKRKEKLAINAKTYLPTGLIATGTIACIFASNLVTRKQQAAMAQAYFLLSQSFQEYKAAVETATDELAMEKIVNEKPRPRYKDPDKLSFYIEYYDRIFESTMLEVVDAEYHLNRKLIMDGCVMVNDLLELLGLPRMQTGDILGWDYNTAWVDFDHGIVDVDGMDCFVITPRQRPWIDMKETILDE